MRYTRKGIFSTLVLALACVTQAQAASYDFDVAYSGNGNATLLAGSDDPIGTNLEAGDTFTWTITATGDGYWRVDTGGDFFPLMAFGVNPSADRVGDFALALRLDGVEVFNTAETGATNSFVHIGTNTIFLDTGLEFDQMFLVYALQSAIDQGLEVASVLQGPLPIFGAPEANEVSPGIAFVGAAVPLPASLGLLVPGLLALGARRRRHA